VEVEIESFVIDPYGLLESWHAVKPLPVAFAAV
jgi:hypothetical protein